MVYEPEAILNETSLNASKDEYRMRVRVSPRALWAMIDMRHLLTFTSSKLLAWQLWSHKLLRYLSFLFMITAYISNLLLWPSGATYKALFVLQNICYAAAIFAPYFEKCGNKSKSLYFLYYFLLLNLASAHAFINFFFAKNR